jgi:curved DNA-binding protein CbpA
MGEAMKSAYAVLGIPGNADASEIEAAYLKGIQYYSKERIAQNPDLLDKRTEIKDAYKLLSNPEFRAAHDRKLSTALSNSPTSAPRVILLEQEAPWFSKPLNLIALLVVLVFAVGGYMSYSRQQEKKARADSELAQKQLDIEAAKIAQQNQARQDQIDAQRLRLAAESERNERQLRSESSAVANQAAAMVSQEQQQLNRQLESDRRNEQQLAQQRARDAKNEERQRVVDAERRVATDKQKLRDLCWQNYRKYDC